ncbi:MAG: DNA polymerase I [Clostridiales bacterium]|nr:DNA polymerase I [Clostridiales bacterium]
MAEKLVCIDGHSILNRAFYGVPELTNSEGFHTNGIYGFFNIMLKIVEEENPQYLAVAFDRKEPTFRHQLFGEYKGTRKPMPEELREQVPVLKEVLTACGIPIYEMPGYEADDILGTLSRKGEALGMEVVLVSGDRDLLQLATEHTCIRIPKTKGGITVTENYRAEDVREKYQVTPTEFIDVKALMGDSSDNIPGVPSIGEKTATNLIVAYGSIENIREHLDEVKPPRARKALEEHFDLAEMSKTLAKICVEAPVELDPEAVRLSNIYTREAYEWMAKLELKTLMKRFHVEDFSEEEGTPKVQIRRVGNQMEGESILHQMEQAACVGWTTLERETENPFLLAEASTGKKGKKKGEPVLETSGIALFAAGDSVVWEFPLEGAMTMEWMNEKIRSLAGAVPCLAVLNLKQEKKRWDLEDQDCWFDVGVASYLINPLKSTYLLDDVARDTLGENILPENPAEAARILAQSAVVLKQKLEDLGMTSLFSDIEMPLVGSLDRMEKAGVRVKREALAEYGESLVGKIQTLEQEIYELAGKTFNILSPKQLGEVLFEEMKLPYGKKTKTGYSTSADVLEKLKDVHPIINKILEYRTLTKLKSTYADGLAVFIGSDERIHGNFHQTITATGRISSTEPNLQNIPVRMELGRAIRKVFVPEDGCVFVDADYSQIELRILAHMSGDEQLIYAYQQEQDIHRMTASQVFHIPFDEVTPEQRRNAKAVNFGIVYGISAFGLSEDLSISRKEASEYIERYFETYPGVKQYLDYLVEMGREKGYVETMFGRRRPVPELKSSNFMQRSFGERVAMNAPIQGTAADIMKIAMVRVERALKEAGLAAKIILQVHDELLVEAPEAEKEQAEEILIREMRGAADLRVPLEIGISSGYSWYDAK